MSYTGKVEKEEKKYVFKMSREPNIKSYYFLNIANPTIDSAFKRVLYTENEITRSFLNSILFPNTNRIIKVEFLPFKMSSSNLYYYNTCSIRFDCLCKCKLTGKKRYTKKKNNDNEIYGFDLDNKEIIIDIEMQICSEPNLEETYSKFSKYLSKNYYKNKILILSLIYHPQVENTKKNKDNIINNQGYIFKNPIDIINKEDCIIYQLNLNYCYKKIKEGKDIYVLNKNQILDEQGIEWIKFFTTPLWCDSLTPEYFAFPPIEELLFDNDNVSNALKILVYQGSSQNIQYELDYIAQDNLWEEIGKFQSLKGELENVKNEYENLQKKLDKINRSKSKKKKKK